MVSRLAAVSSWARSEACPLQCPMMSGTENTAPAQPIGTRSSGAQGRNRGNRAQSTGCCTPGQEQSFRQCCGDKMGVSLPRPRHLNHAVHSICGQAAALFRAPAADQLQKWSIAARLSLLTRRDGPQEAAGLGIIPATAVPNDWACGAAKNCEWRQRATAGWLLGGCSCGPRSELHVSNSPHGTGSSRDELWGFDSPAVDHRPVTRLPPC